MTNNRTLSSLDVFKSLETEAIAWGRQFQIATVGDIVKTVCGKRTKSVMISRVSVTMGRNARKTTLKTLVIEYVGRRMKKNGEFIDDIGTGICLSNFETKDGKKFLSSESGISETVNDCGLSFDLSFDLAAKRKYPNAYQSYCSAKYPYKK